MRSRLSYAVRELRGLGLQIKLMCSRDNQRHRAWASVPEMVMDADEESTSHSLLARGIAACFKARIAQANTQIRGSNEKTQVFLHMRHM